MRKLGEAKANIAIARSLLEVAYVILKDRRRYQEPDPKQMHELEKAKLVRHHAKHLRQLGADEKLVEEMVARLNQPEACTPAEQNPASSQEREMIRRASPAKVCRGALGFRARQTRKQEYSVLKERAAEGPSQVQPRSKSKTKSKAKTLKTE